MVDPLMFYCECWETQGVLPQIRRVKKDADPESLVIQPSNTQEAITSSNKGHRYWEQGRY